MKLMIINWLSNTKMWTIKKNKERKKNNEKNDNFKQKHILGCFSVEFGKYKKWK